MTEGLIGGGFSEAGGGRFGDGFLGAFAGSESSDYIGGIGGSPGTNPGYFNPAYESARVAVAAIVGGTVSSLTGGDFSDGAVAAVMQRLYNDDHKMWVSHNETLFGKQIPVTIEGYLPSSTVTNLEGRLDAAF